jgi:hypothetical protein
VENKEKFEEVRAKIDSIQEHIVTPILKLNRDQKWVIEILYLIYCRFSFLVGRFSNPKLRLDSDDNVLIKNFLKEIKK